jgi:hypothetical protein
MSTIPAIVLMALVVLLVLIAACHFSKGGNTRITQVERARMTHDHFPDSGKGEKHVKMHSSISSSRLKLLLLIITLLLALPGMAQAQDADPPSRVARLNFIEGSVSFLPAGTSDWVTANPNRPLSTGDQLWADQGSRGELHMGGSVLRLSSQTAVSFLNLTDQAVQIQVAQGSASLRVRHLEDNES